MAVAVLVAHQRGLCTDHVPITLHAQVFTFSILEHALAGLRAALVGRRPLGCHRLETRRELPGRPAVLDAQRGAPRSSYTTRLPSGSATSTAFQSPGEDACSSATEVVLAVQRIPGGQRGHWVSKTKGLRAWY